MILFVKNYLFFWHNTTWLQKTLEDDLYGALLSSLELHSSSLPFSYVIWKMEKKISVFVFHDRKKLIQVWKDMGLNK